MGIESIPRALGYVQSPRLRLLARRAVAGMRWKYGSKKSRAEVGFYQKTAQAHIKNLKGLAFDQATLGLELQVAIMFRNAGHRQAYIERLVDLTEWPDAILPDFARSVIHDEIARR